MTEALTRFDRAREFYINELKYNGASQSTIDNYGKRINTFRSFWLDRYGGVPKSDPSSSDFEDWRNTLMEKGLKANTVSQYLKELRFFFNYVSDPELGDLRMYESNPVYRRLSPRVHAKPYDELLTPEQLAMLFVNEKPKNYSMKNWERNYAIVTFILTTGLRNSEVLDLCERDLDWDNDEVVVERGKGSKYRVVDFDRMAKSSLALYFMSRKHNGSYGDDAPVFGTNAEKIFQGNSCGCDWHRGTSQWLSSLIERHVYEVTGVHNIRSHDLRHLCARIDLTGGVGMELLQGKLGHSNPSITQIYSGKLTARKQMQRMQVVFKTKIEQTELNEQKIDKLSKKMARM